jgi:hypothetical protein
MWWSLVTGCARVAKDTSETGSGEPTLVVPPPTDTAPTRRESGASHSATSTTGGDSGPVGSGFTATVYQDVGGELRPALGAFDAGGCYVDGSAVPVPQHLAQVAVTAGGQWFAIGDHEFGEVDPVAGTYQELFAGGPHTGATLAGTMSITVEPGTGAVLVATRAGSGDLLVFDPVTLALNRRGYLDGRDVVAVAALATGQLAALEQPTSGNAVGRLLVFDPATGAYLGGVALATSLPQPEPSPSVRDPRRTWQLRETSLGLVAVVRSTTHPPADTFLLDSSGNVTPLICP